MRMVYIGGIAIDGRAGDDHEQSQTLESAPCRTIGGIPVHDSVGRRHVDGAGRHRPMGALDRFRPARARLRQPHRSPGVRPGRL